MALPFIDTPTADFLHTFLFELGTKPNGSYQCPALVNLHFMQTADLSHLGLAQGIFQMLSLYTFITKYVDPQTDIFYIPHVNSCLFHHGSVQVLCSQSAFNIISSGDFYIFDISKSLNL